MAFISVFFGDTLSPVCLYLRIFRSMGRVLKSLYLRIFRSSGIWDVPLSPYFSEYRTWSTSLYLRIFRSQFIPIAAFISVFFGASGLNPFAFISVFFGVHGSKCGLYLRIFRSRGHSTSPLSPYFSEIVR